MIPCVIFLNELSFDDTGDRPPAGIIPFILSALQSIRAAKQIRQDLIVAGTSTISKIAIGGGAHSLSSLLRGGNYREEWRFIKVLDQECPGDILQNAGVPNLQEFVTYDGRNAVGIFWANRVDSLVLSLGFPPHWEPNQITAQLTVISNTERTTSEITVPNISMPQHANEHSRLIANLGMDLSASSVIYECDDFIARMYFNDHPPAHFHVFMPSDTAFTVATVEIETLDVLSGRLTGRMYRLVRDWAEGCRVQLLHNWTRCRQGQHPIRLN
jgi:hypothetical protein